eukprot:TRINITY_DN7781_c1_g1_i1.p1 TRINITY_DN7781_c1_g1~~TRINITY_DN7781_c1_g1_i1.p1  ORF type:complete len:614 (-),score=94.82 TRINITY_DN7781_c1_g1_i1:74-1915(-)
MPRPTWQGASTYGEAGNVALTSYLERLLAAERDEWNKFIHNSHLVLSRRFEHFVFELCETGAPETWTALKRDGDFTKPACVNDDLRAALADPVDRSGSHMCPAGSLLSDRYKCGMDEVHNVTKVQEAEPQCEETDFFDEELQNTRPRESLATQETATPSVATSVRHPLEDRSSNRPSYDSRKSQSKNQWIRRSGSMKNLTGAQGFINNPIFEATFAGLIFFNTVCMGMEQQYSGFETGYQLNVPGYTKSAKEAWPTAETVFMVSEFFFGVVFTAEVLLKVIVFRFDFFKSLWNLYDGLIILFWLVQNVALMNYSLHPLILRLARLCRLFRLLRFAKAFQVFDVLHLLVHSMWACMTALMWSMIFLAIVMMGTAIVLIYMLEPQLTNEEIEFEERVLLYTYFGTFTNGMFSMYELTMGNWVPISRTVVSNVSDWYIVLFILYRTFVGFAVLKVVTAIFNAETFRITQSDDGIMLMHKERQVAIHTGRMQALLQEGDESEDGFLTLEEFQVLLSDRQVKKWLAAQEIEFKDVEVAFDMLDLNGDGRIAPEELVRGLSWLKGSARSVDLVNLALDVARIEQNVDRLVSKLPEGVNHLPPPAQRGRGRLSVRPAKQP